jgi:hypothetical protein
MAGDDPGAPPVEPLVLATPEVRRVVAHLNPPGAPGTSATSAAAATTATATAAAAGSASASPSLAQDDFVLLACDGLFDVCSNQAAVAFAAAQLAQHGDPRRAARALAQHAVALGSSDNVSVLLVLLRPDITNGSRSLPAAATPRGALVTALPTAPVVPVPPMPEPEPPAELLALSTAAAEAAAEQPQKEAAERVTPSSAPERAVFTFAGAGPVGLQLGQEEGTGWLRVSRVVPGGRAAAAGLRKHALVVGIAGAAAEGSGSDGGSGRGAPAEDTRTMPHDRAAARLKGHLEAGSLTLTVVYGENHQN